MVDPDISKYASLLKQQYLFQGLNDAQLAHVVTHVERIEKFKDDVIYAQGSPGDKFYVIFQGRVRVTQKEGQRERQLRILNAGDYFGEGGLLFKRPRSDTITALEPTVLLRLSREDFFELLEIMPSIRMNLSATAESRYLALKENFDWLSDDEVIYLIRRKHELFLLISLIPPVILGLIALPIFVLSFSQTSPSLTIAALLFGIFGMIGSVMWGIWNWLDWGNDFYIVTSQRVVWLERVIFFYYSRQEAPLTQVLSVNVKTSFIGRIFNYGSVDVRTFTGGIPMQNMTDPKQFASYVEGFQSRAQRQQREAEAEVIEKELHKRIHKESEPLPVKPAPPKPAENKKKPKQSALQYILDTFLKVRFEQDNVITYRKHWLVLIGKTLAPTMVFLMLVILYSLLLYQYLFRDGIGISGLPVSVLAGLLLFAVILWWGYHYLDWNNDIYQLTPEQIVDIERKPLGEEQKKTAPLDSILSLEHARLGIIQLIFNFGNVVINVGQTKFIFRGVHNPDQVHQDVADYIEARRRKRQEVEAERERKRMLDWFGTYHQQHDEIEQSKKDTDWDLFPG
ncbi:MAG TPA: cyclic nucleotide-binding domain-containing protein [Anaerolineales bacterium]